jgi:hypothetical protein
VLAGTYGRFMMRSLVSTALALLVLTSCGSGDTGVSREEPTPESIGGEGELFPDVIGVDVTETGDRTFTFTVTISSPYDRPERYADAWRVVAPNGAVLGVRELLHDHAGEQPFTRLLVGVVIPVDVGEVLVEARDQVSGWGGETMTVAVPAS